MDNNFEENKAAESTSAPETADSAVSPENAVSENAEQPAQDYIPADGGNQTQGDTAPVTENSTQNAAPYTSQPQYIPPQGMSYDMSYLNGMGTNPQPVQNEPRKKYLSGGCFWSLISAVIVLFAIIVVLCILIAKQNVSDKGMSDIYKDITQTQTAEHTAIEIPQVQKPVLEDKYYENEETGLLTSVGVAKTILPSQVQVKVFDSIPYAPISTGSGIIITEDGLILTNAHVVDGGVNFSVLFYDGTESEAEVIGIDKKSDLAVISVDREGLTPAQIGTSSSLEIGEEVVIAGAGGGFENTVTYGHVTGLGREIDTDYISSSTILCIQSDAALNPGNSGGALVNMYGQVVGVAVALMDHGTYENIGFSIAIDDAVPIIEDLISYGYVSTRTRVGITYTSLGDAAASEYGVKSGLCVMGIDPGCDVANSGIKMYDIITEIDGVRVFGAEEIAEVLSGKVPDDTITLTVFRKKVTGEIKEFTVDIKLEADTSSISGYSSATDETDYFSRDIIE